MIEKPNLRDEKIIFALNEHYAIPVVGVEFLPIGNDPSAWAYRVSAENQNTYFLKIRREIVNPAGFVVSRFLQESGIVQVLAPLPTKEQELWVSLEGFFLILYPFVTGTEAMEIGMSDSQWREFGAVWKQIHGIELPSHLSRYLRRETFMPPWSPVVKDLHKRIHTQVFDEPSQNELAAFWQENHEVIQTVIERTEMIGKHLQQAHLEFVLCHADIHTANILITPGQDMFIVDWDDTLLAPKERDLMFVLSGDRVQTREEQCFFAGYGNVEIHPLALAYYRYEWCVQEIGDFGTRVFFGDEGSESTKQNAVEGFIRLFSQSGVIETALNTPYESGIPNQDQRYR